MKGERLKQRIARFALLRLRLWRAKLVFLFVAKTDKISNLRLAEDISKILKFIESEVSGI